MNKKLLDILACPICKSPLDYFPAGELLVCRAERLVFPIRDGVPILLEVDSKTISSEQLDSMDKERAHAVS